jgi:hypothetical protein
VSNNKLGGTVVVVVVVVVFVGSRQVYDGKLYQAFAIQKCNLVIHPVVSFYI